jgi:GAF domain-containing protein
MARLDPDYLAELPLKLHALADTARVAEQIAQIGSQAAGCRAAAVSIVRGGGRTQPAASTCPEARAADAAQDAQREGPGRTALADGEDVLSSDLATEKRWPRWAADALALGFRSCLAVPLLAEDRPNALLQLYSSRRAGFGADERWTAKLLARHSAPAFIAVLETEELRRAMDSRTVIGQAQGILMERYGLAASAAFDVLKRYSQDANVKLRAVAEQVVRERRLPDAAEQVS